MKRVMVGVAVAVIGIVLGLPGLSTAKDSQVGVPDQVFAMMAAEGGAMRQGNRRRVVIVGGGFGGLYAAKSLRRAPVHLTVVDRRNFHLFQPLLSDRATARGLLYSPEDSTCKNCHPIK